ncbi:HET-domain-containing protein [Stipitochalara longipes BDJ]|nr:HET-domain-containing protein [Stipitochalara longipes BDJ]
MEPNNAYQYSRLTGEDTIRIVHLQPSNDLESTIQCSLKDATLTEYRHDIADHYVALSYVWGDASDKCFIIVDGKQLNITASLDSALRHIRDIRRVLHVWADGVCINQNDVEDRNRQVRLMGEIYSTAEHTIIFLGLSSPQCEFAIKSVESLLSEPQTDSSANPLKKEHIESIIEDEILARSWSTRIWIFQELLLSRDPWLQSGLSQIGWDLSVDACYLLAPLYGSLIVA